jgi:hypothetical protein
MTAFLLMLACVAGPGVETLIDDLRVVAIVAEPPEVAPGATSTLTATVADPTEEGVELLMWTCTDLGEGCVEGESAEPGTWPASPEVTDGLASVSATVSPFLSAIVDDTEALPLVTVWALACAPGICPTADELSAEQLADPSDLMATLPLEGVALSVASLWTSMRTEPHQNPLLAPDFDSTLTVAPGEEVDLDFLVTRLGDETAELSLYGYASAGGFALPTSPVIDTSPATRTYFAPEDAVSGDVIDLWVVLVDDLGGAAVWTGTLLVE